MLPAVAQGAIGIERRISDANTAEMLSAIHDVDTGYRLDAEGIFKGSGWLLRNTHWWTCRIV